MRTGTLWIDGPYYNFNEDGSMHTGLLKENGKTYYFDTDTIEMCDNEVRKWEGHLNDIIFQNIKAGTYYIYDSLKTKQYQCDSIHKLTLIVHSTSLQSEIKERIAQSYRDYNKTKQITSMELEALEDLIATYEEHGGENSFVHSKVQKEMYTWEVK